MILKIKNYPNITTDAQHYGIFEKMQGVYEVVNDEDISYCRTTANVRFRWIKAISTQIAKATSYIRKRCTKLIG